MKGINPFHNYRAYCPDPVWRKKPYCNGCPHLREQTAYTARGNPYTDRTCSKDGLVKVRGG